MFEWETLIEEWEGALNLKRDLILKQFRLMKLFEDDPIWSECCMNI